MNPYLPKLRVRDQQTHASQEPSKPSKPTVPVVTYRDTTAGTSFEGFDGDQVRPFSRNDGTTTVVEQTASEPFHRAFEHLQSRCPDLIPNNRWQEAIQDSRHFLVQWAAKAEALGWTARDLFGLAPIPDKPHPSYRRLSRYDETGLIWLLQGHQVLALTETIAAVERPTGAVTVYRRHNKPALGQLGDSLEDLS